MGMGVKMTKKEKLKKKVGNIVPKPTKPKKPDLDTGPIEVNESEGGTAEHIGAEDEVFESLNGIERNEHYRFIANQKYFNICVYVLGTVAVAAFIIYGIMHLSSIVQAIRNFLSIISTFIAGFFIAFILNPLVKWLERVLFTKIIPVKRARNRMTYSIVITYIIIVGLIVLGVSYIIPQLATSVSDLVKRQEYLYRDALEFLNSLEERFPQIDFAYIEKKLESMWPQLVNYGTNLVMDVFPRLLSLGISIARVTINVLLSIAISIYMLFDKRGLAKMSVRFVYTLLPAKKAFPLTETLRECGSIFTNFLVGKTIDSTIIGIICFVAMSIVGLPFAMLVSVIVGITNMIPYFGPFIGAIPGILLFLFLNPMDAVIFTIMIFIIQQFDGWVLGPLILGEKTGMGPLWIIFAITVGGAYWGVLGMFLGVPVIAVIAYLMNRLIDEKLKKKHVDIK